MSGRSSAVETVRSLVTKAARDFTAGSAERLAWIVCCIGLAVAVPCLLLSPASFPPA